MSLGSEVDRAELDDPTNWVPINVGRGQPVPFEVLTPILRALGAMWPSAHMRASPEPGVLIRIPAHEKPERLTKTEAKALARAGRAEAVGASDLGATAFHDGTVSLSPPEELTHAIAAIVMNVLDTTDGATNYVEWTVQDAEGRSAVLTVAHAKGRTPDALRWAAERRAERAEARVKELEAKLA